MYIANPDRYKSMKYIRAGKSGVMLPIISLGFWHNFGFENDYEKVKEMALYAFDHGITHFDLANNYGLPDGSAEINLGKILKEELAPYRDELFISTKAGYYMWPGPYGDHGSRKYLLASLDQSLERLGLPYVDLFYSHRYDSETPLEETMSALVTAVRSGKALYVGLSNYPTEPLQKAIAILEHEGIKPLLLQSHYSILDQGIKDSKAIDTCIQNGVGVIPFSIFNQGLLTGKYLKEIPSDSRMARSDNPFLTDKALNEALLKKLNKLNDLATEVGKTMTQLAIEYIFTEKGVSSALIGVSRLSQLQELLSYTESPFMSDEVRNKIEKIVGEK
ncbi:MAG: aldo/keto reductase [Candidatus Izemoplasmatales bacterium]